MRRAAAALLALAAGCSTARFVGDTYRDNQTAYHLGPLNQSWERHDLGGGNLVFSHPQGGTILVNSTCSKIRDLPLTVLANQALFGVEVERERRREEMTVDGRAALWTQLTGTLDGVPVEMNLVVLKKDGCTYDFGLVASREVFLEREGDFWTLVNQFHGLPRPS